MGWREAVQAYLCLLVAGQAEHGGHCAGELIVPVRVEVQAVIAPHMWVSPERDLLSVEQ
jgi:hypothetical protein